MVSRVVLIVSIVLAPLAVDAAPRKQTRIDVTGVYDSNYGEVRLVQTGTLIEGEYVCCGGGHLQGRLDGRVIKYRWTESQRESEGNGVWRLVGKELVGTWGSGDSEDDGGEWNLVPADKIAN